MDQNLKIQNLFTFEHITYEVKKFRKHKQIILKNLSGFCEVGLNALMGPSGSGKTTLLNILSQRHIPMENVSGKIYYNGKPLPSSFRNDSGYVVQENILVSTLTVRENIMFSAALRIPPSVSSEEKKKLVEEVISDLKLNKCADTRVGTNLIGGISGGQKRRCGIAMELITRPTILYLDEPTSGLDSTTAINVMNLLKRLTKRGCTIIVSIHQPRYGIFRLFDNLILLSDGRLVYQGPADNALPYFNRLGYVCEPHNNPADFFLDVIEESNRPEGEVEEEEVNPQILRQDLAAAYVNSPEYLRIKKVLAANIPNSSKSVDVGQDANNNIQSGNSAIMIPLNDVNGIKNGPTDGPIYKIPSRAKSSSNKIISTIGQLFKEQARSRFPTSFHKQVAIVSKRTLVMYIRNPQIILTHVAVMLIYAFVLGCIYFRVNSSATTGIQNRVGALYLVLMNEVYISLSVIDTFIIERPNFLYEVSNGFYRVSVYFIAKIMGDLIVMKVISTIIVGVVAYWMIGFRPEFIAYITFCFTVFVLASSSNSVAFFCSASFSMGVVANQICSLIYVFMMIFGGFFVNIKTIPTVISWLKYLSIFYYANNAFSANELRGRTFCDSPIYYTNGTRFQNCITGNEYLRIQGIPHKTIWSLWSNHVGLIVINIIFWLLTYIQLRRLSKNC